MTSPLHKPRRLSTTTVFEKAMPPSEKEQVHLKKPFSPSFSFDSRWFCPIDHIPSFRDQLVPSFCDQLVPSCDQLVPSFRDLRMLWWSSLFPGGHHMFISTPMIREQSTGLEFSPQKRQKTSAPRFAMSSALRSHSAAVARPAAPLALSLKRSRSR
jgi:hypothetical protein